MSGSNAVSGHNESLEAHLKRENPLLLEPLAEFRRLDRIAAKMHLLAPDASFTRRVPWWPVISLLGTFSAGKSSFINGYLGAELQRTGNQAVDDRFTVICYSDEDEARTLAGDTGVGRLKECLGQWRRRVGVFDIAILVPLAVLIGAGAIVYRDVAGRLLDAIGNASPTGIAVVAALIVVFAGIHFCVRGLVARRIAAAIQPASQQAFALDLRRAFLRNTRWWRSMALLQPKGWGWLARQRVRRIQAKHETMIRRLNDRFARPSG